MRTFRHGGEWSDPISFVAPPDPAAELERLRAENAWLRREAEALRPQVELARSLTDAVVLTDATFVIRSWNDACRRIYGYDAVEVLGRSLREVLETEFADVTREEIARRLLELGRWRGECLQKHRDGHRVPISSAVSAVRDAHGAIVGYVAVNRDITNEVAARERARRDGERAMQVARLAEELAGAALSVARVLDLCAEGVARIFGDGAVILLRGPADDVLELAASHDPEPGRGARTREVMRAIPPRAGEGFVGRVIVTGEPLMRAADEPEGLAPLLGETFRDAAMSHDVRAVAGVPLAARGRVIGALLCVRFGGRPPHQPDDLRDLQNVAAHVALAVANARLHQEAWQTQAALRGRTRELELAMEELEAVAYSVSHDVRAPLRSIEGLAQLIEDDCAAVLPEEPRDWLRRLRAASVHLAALVDALLALSRVSRWPLRRQPVDVTSLVEELESELARRVPMRAVAVVIAPGLTADADAALLRIAFANLLDNAWKFTGRVAAPRVEVGCTRDDADRAVFSVRDNGAGFDMAFAARLFEPFERLHRQEEFPGTGIGLATVSRIVRRHGGEVWADAAPGRGATFSFTVTAAGRADGGDG